MNLEEVDLARRQLAGTQVKTILTSMWYKLGPDVREFVKGQLLRAMVSAAPTIRRGAGNCAATIIRVGNLEDWADLPQHLAHMLNSGDQNAQTGALCALCLICEDRAEELVAEDHGAVVALLLPLLIKFTQHSVPELRKYAIRSLVELTILDTPVMVAYLQPLLQCYAALSRDPLASVRSLVIKAISALLTTYPEHIAPHLDGVCDFVAQVRARAGRCAGGRAWAPCSPSLSAPHGCPRSGGERSRPGREQGGERLLV